MRHFARARATEGPTRRGWLFMASVGTGVALWASTFISILALDPLLVSGFEPVATGAVLVIAVAACLVGFEIGSRHFTLAPEAGGLVMGVGILAMHLVGFKAWHIEGSFEWNAYGLAMTFVLGLGLSALAVNRANRPVTRWCRHGAAIVLAFMICVMHYSLTAAATAVPDASVILPAYLVPADTLGIAVVAAVLLVMGNGFSTYIIDLRVRTELADRIHQLSFNDTMTGLPNRIAFNERLAFDSAEAHEKAHKLAAFSIDLDGFKDINDLYGHGAGDLLLIDVADAHAQAAFGRRISGAPERRRISGADDLTQSPARCPCVCGADLAGLCRAVHGSGLRRPPHRLDRLLDFPDRYAGTRPAPEQCQARDASGQEQAIRLDLHV